jgi:hypothetical protein
VPHAYIVSDDLASAFNIAAARSGSFSLRTGLHPSAPREELGHQIALGPQHVPQLLWEEAFDARFADLFPDVPATPARAFCSICLVKLLDRSSWEKAAMYLELHGLTKRWYSASDANSRTQDEKTSIRRGSMRSRSNSHLSIRWSTSPPVEHSSPI